MHLLIVRIANDQMESIIAQRVIVGEFVIVRGGDGEGFASVLDGEGDDGGGSACVGRNGVSVQALEEGEEEENGWYRNQR